jgi:ceramidase
MSTSPLRITVIVGAAALIAVSYAASPPIPQDPRYHVFADSRTLLGVPNFWNVISNVPFFLVALYGVRTLRQRSLFVDPWERSAFAVLLAGTVAVGLGSIYYHLRPGDTRLFWDRLPMTVVFTSLLAITIGERIGAQAGKSLLAPLLLLGLGSVVYWRLTADLRPYAVIQFGSMATVLLLLVLWPPRYTGAQWIWGTALLYLLAKLAEFFDCQIASVIALGGHPLKHIAAAAALLLFVIGVERRSLPRSQPESPQLTVVPVPEGVHQ